jgi:hypothetical protein
MQVKRVRHCAPLSVVGTHLPAAFAAPAAFSDLAATALAWLALFAEKSRYSRIAIWVFGLWSSTDLLFAYYQGAIGVGVDPAWLGATWFIPMLWTHVLVFARLLNSSRSGIASRQAVQPLR